MTTKQTRSIDDEEVLKIQDAMKEKMQSGLGLDGSEFLSMLGLGTCNSSSDSPPNAKGAKGSGKAPKNL